MVDEQEDETGGYDPEAMARRRAHVAEAAIVTTGSQEPQEPAAFADWLSAKDAPIYSRLQRAIAALGPKPKPTSGPGGLKLKAALAQWSLGEAQALLASDEAMSAIFSNFPAKLANQPDALYHGQKRAAARQGLVLQTAQRVVRLQAELDKAKAELEAVEAPKRAGREIARAAVQAGYAKLAAAVQKEQARHDRALLRIEDLPRSAIESAGAAEAARFAAAESAFLAKLAALEKLELNLKPVSSDAI